MTPEELKVMDGYGRQSEATRDDSVSLEVQREKCEAWATMRGATLGQWHTDPNVSGSLPPLERPGFAAAIERIKSGASEGIVISDMSRLSRGHVTTALETIRQIHDDLGGSVVIVDLGIDPTTATGEAIFTVLLAMARLEWRTTSEKINDGKLKAARAGKCLGVPEIGYRLDDLGYRVPSEDADLVRAIFERVVADGVTATLHWLQHADADRAWTAAWLRRVLARPVYKGEPVWNGIRPDPGAYETPAIVDLATFTRANERATDGKGETPSPRAGYPLTGRCICAECGGRMRGTLSGLGNKRNSAVRAYRGYCKGHKPAAYIKADVLEPFVHKLLMIEAEYREMNPEDHPEIEPNIATASDLSGLESTLVSAQLRRDEDARDLDLPADVLAVRMAAHNDAITAAQQAYQAALAAHAPAPVVPTSSEIERDGVAGLARHLDRLGVRVAVRPGHGPVGERVTLDEAAK